MALGNLLNSLGAKADANLISQIGGLTRQGISMHGLSQAASYYGIQLTGLKVDSGQLKPNDIVLLNINGNNHYALILGKLGNNYIIQDPFLGTVIMSQEQFNKYYTGNALTTNPNGRGTPLSIEEMKNLFGAGLKEAYEYSKGMSKLPFYVVNPIGSYIGDYTAQKTYEATQKAWQTGNFWDFWDYTFLTIPGYKNWDGWGVGNIKALLDFGLGIDENGDMSMGNTIINVVSLIPIARVASWAGRSIKGAGILEKLGLNINLGDNALINGIKQFAGDIGNKFKLNEFDTWKNLVSGVSSVVFPNPVGWFTGTLEFGAKLTKNENLISTAKYLNDFQLKRGIGDLGGFISDPIGKLKDGYFKTGKLLNDNINYIKEKTTQLMNSANQAYEATKNTLIGEYQKAKSQGLNNYIKTEAPKYITKIKNNPTVQAIIKHPLTQKAIGYGKTLIKYGKTAYNTLKSVGNTIYNGIKSIGTTIYNGVQSLGNTIYNGVTNLFRW
ncbi:MAG: hypothetical protein HZC47_04605 [Methanobacterium sp.]|nr:hypothetical protein [Methanobacterium sp.]